MNRQRRFNIPISRPELSRSDRRSVLEVLKTGWIVQGPLVKKFEEDWSQFTGAQFSTATSSCTSALTIALRSIDVGPGDEVIVPAFTWISSATAVENLGATPIFCDIDLFSMNIDASKIAQLVTKRTKAIMMVHLFGLAADVESILRVSEEYDLHVIEDAACGFGSKYGGRHVGAFGVAGAFSFHPRKAITTGEGGMLTTSSAELDSKFRSLRDHGADKSDRDRHMSNRPFELPEFSESGYNMRMTDLQAALGVSQMRRADSIVKERRDIADLYRSQLSDLEWIGLPHEPEGSVHSYQSFACHYKPEELMFAANNKDENALTLIRDERNALMEWLQERGISTRPATHSVPNLAYFKSTHETRPMEYPNSLAAYFGTISLPIYSGMGKREVEYVCRSLHHYSGL